MPDSTARSRRPGPTGEAASDPGVFIDPRPPQPGETRTEIVDDFLDAMQATPIQTRTAKEFLTQDAAPPGTPSRRRSRTPSRRGSTETPGGVTVTLTGADHLDAQGAWQGALPLDRRTIDVPDGVRGRRVAHRRGARRADRPRDLVRARRFRQVSLYFFDPTAEILAPEPVFVPERRAARDRR